MFNGEMVKTIFPLKKILVLENIWVQEKVGLRKFSPYFFFSIKP